MNTKSLIAFICIIISCDNALAFEYRIAASNANNYEKKQAHIVCNGKNDTEVINKIIESSLATGTTIKLSSGTFFITKNSRFLDNGASLGGIIISKSNITLSGCGKNTILLLKNRQFTNVIRIYSNDNDLDNIRIENLTIDGNVSNNPRAEDIFPRFESTGIKVLGYLETDTLKPERYKPIRISNVTIDKVHIFNTTSLGAFLGGENIILSNSTLGQSSSHSVEVLIGPGKVINNHFIIDGDTLNVMATDAARHVIFSGNTVSINSGKVDSVFSTWPEYSYIIFSDNIINISNYKASLDTIFLDRGKYSVISNNIISVAPEVIIKKISTIKEKSAIFSNNIINRET